MGVVTRRRLPPDYIRRDDGRPSSFSRPFKGTRVADKGAGVADDRARAHLNRAGMGQNTGMGDGIRGVSTGTRDGRGGEASEEVGSGEEMFGGRIIVGMIGGLVMMNVDMVMELRRRRRRRVVVDMEVVRRRGPILGSKAHGYGEEEEEKKQRNG